MRDIRIMDLVILPTMDPCSLDVLVEEQVLCRLQWHEQPLVSFPTNGAVFIELPAAVLSHLAFTVRDEHQKYKRRTT